MIGHTVAQIYLQDHVHLSDVACALSEGHVYPSNVACALSKYHVQSSDFACALGEELAFALSEN